MTVIQTASTATRSSWQPTTPTATRSSWQPTTPFNHQPSPEQNYNTQHLIYYKLVKWQLNWTVHGNKDQNFVLIFFRVVQKWKYVENVSEGKKRISKHTDICKHKEQTTKKCKIRNSVLLWPKLLGIVK